ncbi:MAG: virulence RhuM family protein [Dysgonamonadaceae bacterium]|nr:virulence RhuM family protein [Dysgonamonadaceae bacterium]
MKLKFKHQRFQADAAKAVCDVFAGQPYKTANYAIQFRIWATQVLSEFYATADDYQKDSLVTRHFYAKVQNKLHWAITGLTAAEIIYTNVDASKINMGLTNWKLAPDGKIMKSDVAIAKNYLSEAHIKELNQIFGRFLARDPLTNQEGYILAVVLLFSKEQTVLNCCPWHRTDAIYRNMSYKRFLNPLSTDPDVRYNDRDMVCVNLIESYGRKNLVPAKRILKNMRLNDFS